MLGPGTLEGQLWARCHRENPLCPSSAALNQPLPFRLSPYLQAQTHFHRRVGSGDTLGEGCDWIGTCRGHTRAVWATPLSGPHLPGRPCCRNVPRAVFPLLRPLPPAMAASLLRACSCPDLDWPWGLRVPLLPARCTLYSCSGTEGKQDLFYQAPTLDMDLGAGNMVWNQDENQGGEHRTETPGRAEGSKPSWSRVVNESPLEGSLASQRLFCTLPGSQGGAPSSVGPVFSLASPSCHSHPERRPPLGASQTLGSTGLCLYPR